MPQPITILVATMSGTAEMVAGEIQDALSNVGRPSRLQRMERASPTQLREGGLFLVCSSTYGKGEVPDNGKPLYEALKAERPNLSAMRYGVIGLGDMTYSATFCGGGRSFDELLSSLGAVRIGERCQHDASSGIFPEDAALAWLRDWLALLDPMDEAVVGRNDQIDT
jgi:sulfite reductase alpha subunit-like flavoprotein